MSNLMIFFIFGCIPLIFALIVETAFFFIKSRLKERLYIYRHTVTYRRQLRILKHKIRKQYRINENVKNQEASHI